jgi:hypothetical protein
MKLRLFAISACWLGAANATPSRQSEITFSLAAYSSEPASIGFGAPSSVHIETIWISIHDLALVRGGSCKRVERRTIVSGAVTAELVTGRAIGMPATVAIELGPYCGLRVAVRRSQSDSTGVPAEFRTLSIMIRGRRPDGVRITIRSELAVSSMLPAHQVEGFTISDHTPSWILAIDVARWMAGLELSLADATGDRAYREVRIDHRTNADLLARFNANVPAGFGLFLDVNGNRMLDTDERARPVASRGRP